MLLLRVQFPIWPWSIPVSWRWLCSIVSPWVLELRVGPSAWFVRWWWSLTYPTSRRSPSGTGTVSNSEAGALLTLPCVTFYVSVPRFLCGLLQINCWSPGSWLRCQSVEAQLVSLCPVWPKTMRVCTPSAFSPRRALQSTVPTCLSQVTLYNPLYI